jgi:F0F1-type ATP synthase assembly protein I
MTFKLVKEWAKTIAAFVLGVLVSIVTNLMNGTTPWPQTNKELIQLLIMAFVPAIGVALTRNKITQAQLDKDKHVIGGVVVPDAQVAPTAPEPNTPTDENGDDVAPPWQP